MIRLPATTIEWIQRLGRSGLDPVQIGRRTGYHSKTVDKVLAGEARALRDSVGRPRGSKNPPRIHDKPTLRNLRIVKVSPYTCPYCLQKVTYRPCIICRAARPLGKPKTTG